MTKTLGALWGTLAAAVAALAVVHASAPVPQNPSPAPPTQLDPPLPPGAADDIAARMATRRAAQLTQGAQATAPGDAVPFNGRTPEQIEAELLARRAALQALQAAAEAQASQTQVIAPTTAISPTTTLALNEGATLDTVLADMSRAFGFIVIKNVPLTQRVTIQIPKPVNADEALRLLDAVLYMQGYGTVRTQSSDDPVTAKTILRIATIQEIRKSQIPIYEGADPDKIAITDRLITQIIPVKNISAPGLRNDLIALMSADADVASNAAANCIVVTDTSAKIHRLVTLIATLDKVAGDRPATPAAAAGRGGITRPSDVPFIMSAVVDGAAFQIRHGDILGEVQAPKATLTAPAAGILAKMDAQEGQAVKAGDIVCEFDTRAAQAELQTAQAHLLEVRSQLLPPGAARGDTERNQAEIAAAEAVAARDRFALESLQVRAPIDGSLTSFDFTPGQYLAAGTALTQIVDNQAEDFKLSFRLAFNDRTLLKVGQKITFTVSDKLPPFPAEITFISPTADTSNRTEVRARFVGRAEPLVPGVMGTVTIPELPAQ